MKMLVGKVHHKIFSKGGYYIFASDVGIITYRGDNPPKPLKTVSYVFSGKWKIHPEYGPQFDIKKYRKANLTIVQKLIKNVKMG